MIEDSGIGVILTMRSNAKFLPTNMKKGIDVIHMDNFWSSQEGDGNRKRARTREESLGTSYQFNDSASDAVPSKEKVMQRRISLPANTGSSVRATPTFIAEPHSKTSPKNGDKKGAANRNWFADDAADLAYIIFTSGSTGNKLNGNKKIITRKLKILSILK